MANQACDALRAVMGPPPRRIPHWEHLSNPDFEQYVTGIDPYEHPRQARLKLKELYRIDLGCGVPAEDKPIPRPTVGEGSELDEHGRRRVRWGTGHSSEWDWGKAFHSIEEVRRYEPLKHLDLSDREKMPVVENRNYGLDDEAFYRLYAGEQPRPAPPEDELALVGFYNTMFMWPLLTFGWPLFLELAGGYPDDLRRILADFAEINRKVFRTFARLPVHAVVCHDDICMTGGPICSPAWLREFIYPYYEEFWDMVKRTGKKVIFMSDGNIDKVVDDVAACGADGFVSEPYTDWKAIARRYPDKVLAGEGDNRILSSRDRRAVVQMVDRMVETGRMCGGYFMCVGNHIPWNVPPEMVKLYFDLSQEKAYR